MKPSFEQLTKGIGSSISVTGLSLPGFEGPYHFHPEMELTWIQQGTGKRYVGSKVSEFEKDDLVLLGANIPHCWKTTGETPEGSARAMVIQFRQDFAGDAFLNLPELGKIQKLFEKAKAGILIKGKTRKQIITLLKALSGADSLQKLLKLLQILDLIASSDEIEVIDPLFAGLSPVSNEAERFHKVFSYLIDHYQQEISLQTIAGIANLTPTSFCRYFKEVTRKTLVEIVNELRINLACQLLRMSVKPVNEICFECGFGNISYIPLVSIFIRFYGQVLPASSIPNLIASSRTSVFMSFRVLNFMQYPVTFAFPSLLP
ncbi:MAG: AraC family transcriptional regulator [Bacteroidales bacterium]|nr:AraC family transcriptional regulator [Bacteroidales bacterium]